jgi:hypothetical protein
MDTDVLSLKEAQERKIAGTQEELFSFINGKITDLMAGIKIIPLDENISYTAEGKVSRSPRVQVVLEEKMEKIPIQGFPLKAKFVSGNGKLLEEFNSAAYGIAEINIEQVEPSFREAVVEVSVNSEKLGIRKEDIVTLPAVGIKLTKLQTAAVYVNFTNVGSTAYIPEFVAKLKDLLSNAGYSVVDTSSKDISRVRSELNVDFLLSVELRTTATGPDAFGAYTAYISGEARMFSTDDAREIFVVSCPQAKGEHLSKSAAGLDAFSRISTKFLTQIEQKIKTLRR